jgi:hypothetical protein
MTLLADLEAFVHDHRPYGPLTADATEPAWNGYLLTVVCPCGVVFRRWVTAEDCRLRAISSRIVVPIARRAGRRDYNFEPELALPIE